jgi:iron complex outermembrane receptor protein
MSFLPPNLPSRSVTSPSAVAIVTAEDIRAYGYRTIADVLNSMRGLYTTHDYRYAYMGAQFR